MVAMKKSIPANFSLEYAMCRNVVTLEIRLSTCVALVGSRREEEKG